MQVEYYFDFSCPFAYVGSTRIEDIAAQAGGSLVWRPMLLGGVFAAVGDVAMSAAKARHNVSDQIRWAQVRGVPLAHPAGHPIRTVRALRALLSLPEPAWPAAIHSLYRAYWVDGWRIDDAEAVDRALERAGIPADHRQRALAANDDPAIKDELRARTERAVERGVFGAPTTFVGDDSLMFFGQDRLGMVDAALRGWRPDVAGSAPEVASATAAPPITAEGSGAHGATIDFWYDFSSPYSYVGATRIEAIAARAGATLRWRPMLLGAVFKQIGGPDVPMLAASESKRRWFMRDMVYWSSFWQVPFRFATRFPIRSVTALRLALLAGDRIGPLTQAMFRAAWVDDRPLEDESVLADILRAEGLSEDLLGRTQAPETKQQLIDSTAEAVAAGVFGAPTCVVDNGRGRHLFWGQDRFELVERCARGWTPGSPTS